MNNVNLIGRIANDLKLIEIKDDGCVVNFSIAVNRYIKDKQETDFINCVCFNQLAKNLYNYQSKGSLIGVVGSLKQDTYTTDKGEKRSSLKVVANNIQFLQTKPKETNEEFINNPVLDDDDVPF